MNGSLIPLSLYIHVPWCVRKCPYCDFNSHQRPASLPEAAYVDALLADLLMEVPLALGRPVQSIFFGGGTPSLFSGAAIARILDGVRAQLTLVENCEITLETNPGTAEFDRFEAYLVAGVNRISLGVQSFDDDKLRRLGRIHGGAQARTAYQMARAAGVANINLDLMFGLPNQSLQDAIADLQAALELAPEHVSHYQLTLEPQTAFARTPPANLPDEDALVDMLDACQALLNTAGYTQYEVSAYAQPAMRSRHNLNYWLYGDYLAIGAGAHNKCTADGRVRRRVRQRNPSGFLKLAGSPNVLSEDRQIESAELPFEFMLNALRLREGFAAPLFGERTGLALDQQPGFQQGLRRGLLVAQGEQIRATELGYRFLNDTVALFLPQGLANAASN